GGGGRTGGVVRIVVPVIGGRRAGSAVEVDVGASAASVVVDEDPRPRHADGRDEGRKRGRREVLEPGTADHPRGARNTGISVGSIAHPYRLRGNAGRWMPPRPQNSFTNPSRRSSMSCSIRAKVFWKNYSTSLP